MSGVAPVTRRSRTRCIVVMRQTCHRRLRGAVYHWARVAIQHDELSRYRYAALRQRGHGQARALRSVADRLLAVACAMLAHQASFDPDGSGRRAAVSQKPSRCPTEAIIPPPGWPERCAQARSRMPLATPPEATRSVIEGAEH